MTTPTALTMVGLVQGVQAYFTANAISASVPELGWRPRTAQLNEGPGGANRVCFQPGDKNGKGGSTDRGRIPSTNPRTILESRSLITMFVWGVDTTQPNSEQAQVAATRSIWQSAVQAINFVGKADVLWEAGSWEWTVPPVELGFGRELVHTFTFREWLFDPPMVVVTPSPVVNRDPAS